MNCKLIARWFGLLLIVAMLSGPSVLAVSPAGGDLVLHLPMDEGTGTTAFDASGYGNNGDINGATWTTDGVSGDALSFDGVDDYVDCGNDASLNPGTGSWTIEVWFKTQDGRQGLVVKDDNNGGDGYFFDVYDQGQLHFLVRNDGAYDSISGDTQNLDDGEWHHAVAVRNVEEDKLYLYLDGNQDGEATIDKTRGCDIAPSANCCLGNLGGTGIYDFNGELDEARIYSKALTAEGVLHHYTNPTATDNPSTQDSDNHTAVPAMTVWGLAATAAVLGLLAMVILRRRMVVRSDR